LYRDSGFSALQEICLSWETKGREGASSRALAERRKLNALSSSVAQAPYTEGTIVTTDVLDILSS